MPPRPTPNTERDAQPARRDELDLRAQLQPAMAKRLGRAAHHVPHGAAAPLDGSQLGRLAWERMST